MPNEYLNNVSFEKIINRFYLAKLNKEVDEKEYSECHALLADQFYLLADNILRGFKFKLIERDDSLQEGVIICFEKLHHWDPARGTAFTLFTTIIVNHFRQLYRTAKTYNELKAKYHDHMSSEADRIMVRTMFGKSKDMFLKKKIEKPEELKD